MASRRILLPRLLIFPLMVLGPFLAAREVCGRGVKLEAAKGHRDKKEYAAAHAILSEILSETSGNIDAIAVL